MSAVFHKTIGSRKWVACILAAAVATFGTKVGLDAAQIDLIWKALVGAAGIEGLCDLGAGIGGKRK